MKNARIVVFLIVVLFGCGIAWREKTFISCDISATNRFYFISSENNIDRTRPVSIICANHDSVHTFDRFEIIKFDFDDYTANDHSISIVNRIDSAIKIPAFEMDSLCDGPICVQLKSNFQLLSKTQIHFKEINSDQRLSSIHSTCEHMDDGNVYEILTNEGDRYSIYDLIMYKSCDYFQRDLLLFKGSTLINEQHY